MNAVRNTIFITIIFFLMIIMGFIYTIGTPIANYTYQIMNNIIPNIYTDQAYLLFTSSKTLVIQCFYILMSLFLLGMYVSSITEPQSLSSYLVSSVGILIITPLMIFVVVSIWNQFTVAGVTLTDIDTTFINSFPTIYLLNLIFGLFSFIFLKAPTG